jgi:hypothetical protein
MPALHGRWSVASIDTNRASGISLAARRAGSKKSTSSAATQIRQGMRHSGSRTLTGPSSIAARHAAHIATASQVR